MRGVKISTKGHTVERPLSFICSLELKQADVRERNRIETDEVQQRRSRRQAAKDAGEKIRRQMLTDGEEPTDVEHFVKNVM